MTKIEKRVIYSALAVYSFQQQKLAEKARRKKELDAAAEHEREALEAGAILSYWPDVVNAECGTVTI